MKPHLPSPITYLITSGEATNANFISAKSRIIEIVSFAARAGVSLVQIREKYLSARSLFELTKEVVDLARRSEMRVLVNDRADIANAAGADGVHLTSCSLPVPVVREAFGDRFLIGVSTHSAGDILRAAEDEADFAVFGPVFETPGKGPAKGIDELRNVCQLVAPFPVLAIGGVDPDNVSDILHAGVSGVAAIRALNDAGSTERLLAKLI